MASSISIPSCSFATAIPNSTSPTYSSSSSLSFTSGCNGISLHRRRFSSRTCAKFEKFEGDLPQDSLQQNPSSPQQPTILEDEEEEDDSCLPSDLEGAVRQSGVAAATFVSSGGNRAIVTSYSHCYTFSRPVAGRLWESIDGTKVELLIPQLQFLDDEGAQGELWDLSRTFVDTLMEETGCQRVKAVYPDAGAAALLKYKWTDAAFGFASLSDRKPVDKDDEIVVMVVPDYQMLEYVERIASSLSDDPPRPLIMWNPRLVSGDVGVGFNVRQLKRYFLSTFTTVYSMKPLEAGAVFRCYPGLWKVFYDDKERPNRYLLAKELMSRPDAEDLEIIFGTVEESGSDNGPSLFSKAANIFSSINRFMKAIS